MTGCRRLGEVNGGSGGALINAAHIAGLSMARHTGKANLYEKAQNAVWPHLARERLT